MARGLMENQILERRERLTYIALLKMVESGFELGICNSEVWVLDRVSQN